VVLMAVGAAGEHAAVPAMQHGLPSARQRRHHKQLRQQARPYAQRHSYQRRLATAMIARARRPSTASGVRVDKRPRLSPCPFPSHHPAKPARRRRAAAVTALSPPPPSLVSTPAAAAPMPLPPPPPLPPHAAGLPAVGSTTVVSTPVAAAATAALLPPSPPPLPALPAPGAWLALFGPGSGPHTVFWGMVACVVHPLAFIVPSRKTAGRTLLGWDLAVLHTYSAALAPPLAVPPQTAAAVSRRVDSLLLDPPSATPPAVLAAMRSWTPDDRARMRILPRPPPRLPSDSQQPQQHAHSHHRHPPPMEAASAAAATAAAAAVAAATAGVMPAACRQSPLTHHQRSVLTSHQQAAPRGRPATYAQHPTANADPSAVHTPLAVAPSVPPPPSPLQRAPVHTKRQRNGFARTSVVPDLAATPVPAHTALPPPPPPPPASPSPPLPHALHLALSPCCQSRLYLPTSPPVCRAARLLCPMGVFPVRGRPSSPATITAALSPHRHAQC
jgi:hypothetical protein